MNEESVVLSRGIEPRSSAYKAGALP